MPCPRMFIAALWQKRWYHAKCRWPGHWRQTVTCSHKEQCSQNLRRWKHHLLEPKGTEIIQCRTRLLWTPTPSCWGAISCRKGRTGACIPFQGAAGSWDGSCLKGAEKWKWKSLSPVDSLRPHGLYSLLNSPDQNTGVGSLSLLQEIFPTQGLTQVSRIVGEGEGTPLQYSCLENPMDGGAC